MDDELTSTLRAAGFELIETHISLVFLRGAHVYKTKRAVSLGFLDFSSLALRETACLAEVELNRRLCSDVYLGVVALTRTSSGELSFVPREQCSATAGVGVLEWAVHMRRLDERERADSLLVSHAFGVVDLETIASTLAAFHRSAPATDEIAKFGSPQQIEDNVRENFRQIAPYVSTYLTVEEHAQLVDYQTRFLVEQHALLVERAATGHVRDGHGDLRLEHCYRAPAGGYVIVDCIEFNERFRYGDVCADLAFLAMDLTYQGKADLADLLVSAYARASTDYGVYTVLDFYQSYRATVRAKVSALLAQDLDVTEATRERAENEARRYFVLALSAGRRLFRSPHLIVMMGAIASGKSTIAAAVAQRLGAAVLSADYTRKELLGLSPTRPRYDLPFQGAYTSDFSERVYATLLARAALILRSGRSVVLDATFRSRAQRDEACALARSLGAQHLVVECYCERGMALQRLRERAQAESVSDGREEIYDSFMAQFEAPTELTDKGRLRLDTGQPLSSALALVYAELARASPGT